MPCWSTACSRSRLSGRGVDGLSHKPTKTRTVGQDVHVGCSQGMRWRLGAGWVYGGWGWAGSWWGSGVGARRRPPDYLSRLGLAGVLDGSW